ncbi:PAS domain S-box protein [Massilia sp. YIM B02763]|uniref:hybrid sensor histidine kinase/response regulator n=1 Tax=Massilia sp. YIM B02763 TaxID=3050130 RepID=UPI0025B65E26|nr:PAS domain S-box protein [Massilia sp. YIM B02763]MDN4051803.1 PAS domain S-box protein [Massilia sp. YIM B02763]
MADSPPGVTGAAEGAYRDDAVVAALLRERGPGPGDDAAVGQAFAALAQQLADDPQSLLQRVAELARELCGANSVVVAVCEPGPGGGAGDGSVRWHAVAGGLAPQAGARWSIGACACGAPVLADGSTLFEHPASHFPSARGVGLDLGETLGVPWRVNGRALGSLNAMRLEGDGGFDAGHLRRLHACAAFAAAGWQASSHDAAPSGTNGEADGGELERRVEERIRPVLEREEHLQREVEESRAAARALREHKALIDATLSIGTVGVLYFDLDGTVRDVNPAFERMTGYTCQELRTLDHWRDLTPPEFWDVTENALRDLAAAGSTAPYTKQMVRKDGSRWWGLFAPARIAGEGEYGRCVLFVIDVGANKETEARLAESEERFRAMVQGFAQAVWETDAHGRIVEGSASWTQYTGQRAEASLGLGWLDAVHPEDRAAVLRQWRAAVGMRRTLNVEFRVQVAAGGWRWTNARAAPLFNDDGSVRKWVGMYIDVDERRRTQAALGESERRFRMLFESMDEGFLLAAVEFDEAGRATGLAYTEANPAAVRMANISYVGPGRLRVRPEHEPCWLEACAEVVHTGTSSRSQCYAPGVQGWYDFFVFPVGGRESPRVAILFYDITLRKRAEDALRESEGRFRALADASPALVYQFDVDGRVIYLNERCTTGGCAFGPNAQAAQGGRGWNGIVPPADMDGYLRAVFDGVRADGGFTRRIETPVAGGAGHWFESHVSPWFSGEGVQRGYVGISLDITGAVQAEEALKDADRRKDEFLATLAHELRNPLAPISNAVQLMRRPDGRRQSDRVVEMVGRQVRQIVRLVDDLMEVSRITRGKIDLKLERVAFAEIVQAAVETSQPAIDRCGHQLSVALPQEPLVLEADRVRLTQVFANLLNNAAKYTDAGGRIWFDARRVDGMVVASVRDTGIGIPAEALPRVFDMFAQAHRNVGRGQGGLGIGLTMVHSLVEMHHGTVEAKSAGSGLGSEFIVHLPLADPADDWEPAEPFGQARPTAPLHGQRILVVDDNRDAADTLGLLLEADGAEVRIAYDGRGALATADSFLPHSVLLDIGMPGMDGYEVARRLRQEGRFAATRIIALTGWGQDADRRQTRNRGFSHHLTKPVSLEDLHRILADVQR